MKRLLCLLMILLCLSGNNAAASEIAGVQIPDRLEIGDERVVLNGSGIRTKFFFKIYIGSLYVTRPATSEDEVMKTVGPKMIRMDFLYDRVDREKIVAAFADGFNDNSPGLSAEPITKQFLAAFDADFVAGDRVDLLFAGDGTVTVRHNDRLLFSKVSRSLAQGLLLVYLGPDPADAELKAGMLGQG